MREVRVEADSVSLVTGSRLTTFVVTFPRVVLAEAVTHRANFDLWGCGCGVPDHAASRDASKNSASSRAVSVGAMQAAVYDAPYVPAWTENRRGMQGDPLPPGKAAAATEAWLAARDACLVGHSLLTHLGVHKQDANRLLEPWAYVTQVITSANWDNFFALRCHEAAHPAIRRVARLMYLARLASVPRPLAVGDWHLPFTGDAAVHWDYTHDADVMAVSWAFRGRWATPIVESVARCAWVSYLRHDGDGSPAACRATVDKLLDATPVHASPFEHQAMCVDPATPVAQATRSNLGPGWLQLRKLIPAERADAYTPTPEEVESWPEAAEFRGRTRP